MITKIMVEHSLPKGHISSYIKIDSVLDLPIYFEHTIPKLEGHFIKVIKSKNPVSSWDHMLSNVDGSSLFNQCVIEAKFKESNPIFEADAVIQQRFRNMVESINKHGNIIINPVGGYCSLNEKLHTVISEDKHDFSVNLDLYYDIKKNTKIINLENDPELEDYSVDYMLKLDKNYSFITNLRSFSIEKLIEVFNTFVSKGGKTVYIYTTGLDVPQMEEYLSAIHQLPELNVIIDFNAEIKPEAIECIQFYQNKGMNIKYKNIYQ